ncbi:MAG TPA: helix-hairpin-helix domain-containing protein [Nitriliruptorales bacterium]
MLIEGDPALEATLRGIRGLRDQGRESIRCRFMTLAELRAATTEELVALSGIGRATAELVLAAAREVDALVGQVKGLRSTAVPALRAIYPSIGALAEADTTELVDVPGIGPTTAQRLVSAARR